MIKYIVFNDETFKFLTKDKTNLDFDCVVVDKILKIFSDTPSLFGREIAAYITIRFRRILENGTFYDVLGNYKTTITLSDSKKDNNVFEAMAFFNDFKTSIPCLCCIE